MLNKLFLCVGLLFVAFNGQCENSGRINFTGSIVNPACNVLATPDTGNISTTCYQNGKVNNSSFNIRKTTDNAMYETKIESLSNTAKILIVSYK